MKRRVITPEEGMARWIWASLFCAGILFFAPLGAFYASQALSAVGLENASKLALEYANSIRGWNGHEAIYAAIGGFAILVAGDIRAWLKHRKRHRVVMQVRRTAPQRV